MSSHAIVLGCGRSGTSIFGELFEQLPTYQYFSEPDFDTVMQLSFDTPVAIKVPRESPAFPAPNGLSFPLNTLLNTLGSNAVLFWQVRHPLDAIASLRPGISNNWGHHPRPHNWQQWLQRPLLEQCAHHWSYINSVGYNQVKHLTTLCRFEDMIRQPKQFASTMCDLAKVDIDACAAVINNWAGRVQDTNNDQFIEAKTSRNLSRPDHRVRVGRWQENLSLKQLRQVIPIIQDTAKTFGYELPAVDDKP